MIASDIRMQFDSALKCGEFVDQQFEKNQQQFEESNP
jgi:hypothetical protein